VSEPQASAEDWRVQRAPDGRLVEFLSARWGQDDKHTPSGTVPVVITMMIDDALVEQIVYLTADQLGEALGHGDTS
jgi:hypothetical protein